MTVEQNAAATDWVAQAYRDNLSTGRARIAELLGGQVEIESQGAWVTTSDGERHLNAGGYGVFIAGARHPVVVREVERQLQVHPIGTRMFLEPTAARAAQMLASVTPAGLQRIHFCGSGAEATETALKIARLSGHRHLISMHGGYHGKTFGALSVTAKSLYQDPFRPLLPDVTHIPYNDIPALHAALESCGGSACVIVEPVQGEAGVVLPAPGYLHSVRTLCTEFGALLVVDEIQTGLGRLGTWWGSDPENVRPDILLSGKALGGGVLPVAAAIATEDAYAVLDRDPFLHTSTFSAAPLAMAAVCGAIAAIACEGLVERAAELGAELLPAITAIAVDRLGDRIREVRGRGLLIGIEFADPALAGELLVELVTHNVIPNHSLNSERVLRLTPPAVLDRSEVGFLLDRFDQAVAALAGRYPDGER
ncbi:aspartate aminotransferase family protein [Nocardia transvalensis]|uniref:aspartate aminotransferase family protein n=1 Tax=Nocardia transvalensis TaxID=37333 RepID=UPI001892F668|nr:aminotransferase class III-fold pyridoxal phosphate-dependent enzyme [Nocardia transvalensis]MBF6330744.1 aspartate aminotransferase family protein [Nocardia transvalensis]